MVCNQINYRFKQNKIRIKRDKAWQFIDKKEKKYDRGIVNNFFIF